MIEFLIFALVLYIGFKVVWWMIKTTFVLGLGALIIVALMYPSYLFWF
ncbi:MAG: hypothetical protein V3R64_05525 [Sphingomonadales bacterium]